jgi:transaldolase
MNIKIFADGANEQSMIERNNSEMISGLTTNPTLIAKSGVTDYSSFIKRMLTVITEKSLSVEVVSDDLEEMYNQAKTIASWGNNVSVKIPITNTKSESVFDIVKRLSDEGVKVNVTAMMTLEQVDLILPALKNSPGAFISIFAGRIADTGVDPLNIMKGAMDRLKDYPNVELIWASPRELLNIFQADEIGCHVITCTDDIIKKLSLQNKDLTEYSLETVKMFYDDAQKINFSID